MSYIRLALVAFAMALSGCSDPSGALAPRLPISQVLSKLVVNVKSAVLAVGDSLDLSMVAVSITGDTLPIEGGTTPEWGVGDASVLRVTQSGRVYALKSSNDNIIPVGVKWTSNGVTRGDSAYVIVTPTRIPISSIQIRARGDSMRTSFGNSMICCGVYIVARNTDGDSVALLRAPLSADRWYSYYDLSISYMGPNGWNSGLAQYLVLSRILGPYWLRTESLVYGTQMRDSAQFMGLYPPEAITTFTQDSGSVQIASTAHGHSKILQPCGIVRFTNRTKVSIDVTFDDPSKASGCVPGDPTGNIENLEPNKSADRKFPLVGTAVWTARARGPGADPTELSGTVIMREP